MVQEQLLLLKHLLKTINKIVLLINQKKKPLIELPISQSYMTTKQDNKNNNVNPFAVGTVVWQSLMTNWLNAYGEFLKNASRMTEQWYNIFWKPWVNWMPQAARATK